VKSIPLLTKRSQGENIFGEYSAVLSNRWNMMSNRIRDWHHVLKGDITEKLSYRGLLTCTDHWGAYHNRRDFEQGIQWNSLLEMNYSYAQRWQFNLSLAADRGILGNNIGLLLGATYHLKNNPQSLASSER
jgi:hypothetical protein